LEAYLVLGQLLLLLGLVQPGPEVLKDFRQAAKSIPRWMIA
jgi:hypothetical protein